VGFSKQAPGKAEEGRQTKSTIDSMDVAKFE
jgi:hypothetical protein